MEYSLSFIDNMDKTLYGWIYSYEEEKQSPELELVRDQSLFTRQLMTRGGSQWFNFAAMDDMGGLKLYMVFNLRKHKLYYSPSDGSTVSKWTKKELTPCLYMCYLTS